MPKMMIGSIPVDVDDSGMPIAPVDPTATNPALDQRASDLTALAQGDPNAVMNDMRQQYAQVQAGAGKPVMDKGNAVIPSKDTSGVGNVLMDRGNPIITGLAGTGASFNDVAAMAANMPGNPSLMQDASVGGGVAPGQKVSRGTGVEVAESGSDLEKADKIGARAEKAAAKGKPYEQQILRDAEGDVAGLQAATDEQMAAEQAAGEAESAKALAQAEQRAQMAKRDQDYAIASEANLKQSMEEANAVRADYEKSLAEFKAMKVNPGALFQNMTTGGQIGTMMNAFIHDFLGAKGIKTSSMDMFNKAVEQSIDAQVENIKNAGETTKMFRELWQMSMDQSKTEAEAKDRIHGYVMEGMKNQLEATTAQYDSPLALANARKASALIGAQQAERVQRIQESARQTIRDERQRRIDNSHREAELAQGERRLKLDEQAMEERKLAREAEAEAARLKGEGEQAKYLNERIVFDPLHPDQAMGAAHDATEARDFRIKIAAAATLTEKFATVRDLVNGKNFYDTGGTFLNTPEAKRAEAAYEELVSEIAKTLYGASVSDKERESVRKQIKKEQVFGGKVDIAGEYGDRIISYVNRAQNEVGTTLSNLTDSEQALVKKGAVGRGSTYEFAKEQKKDAIAAQKKREQTVVDELKQAVATPHASEEYDGSHEVAVDMRAAGLGDDIKELPIRNSKTPPMVPKSAIAMSKLSKLARDENATPEQREGAYQALLHYSAQKTGTATDRDLAKYYAGQTEMWRKQMKEYYGDKPIGWKPGDPVPEPAQ